MKSILFDPKDPSTMTRAKDTSTKWNDTTVKLTKESVFGVLTVYDNSFGYGNVLDEMHEGLKKAYPADHHRVGAIPHVTHCDFCGQKITYVAVVACVFGPMRSIRSVHQIGCDCLGKIFGTTWYGYRSADSVKKELVNLAKIRSRKAKYAVEYVKYITWLNELPPQVLTMSMFLRDMRTLLTTGNRVFSKDMESYLVRMMKDPRYSKKGAEELNVVTKSILERMDTLIALVKRVDADVPNVGILMFLGSVRQGVVKYGKLTEGQKDALNKVHVRYTERSGNEKKAAALRVTLGLPAVAHVVVPTAATEEIPW